MTKNQFDKAIANIIKNATLEQIQQGMRTLPAEQADALMLAWQIGHNSNFRKVVSSMVADEINGK